MKTDITIDYSVLDDIVSLIFGYKANLDSMQDAVVAIDALLEGSSGQAVEALRESKAGVLAAIGGYRSQLQELHALLQNYIDDTTAVIRPEIRGMAVRVDADDIWRVLKAMEAKSRIRQSATGAELLMASAGRETAVEAVDLANRVGEHVTAANAAIQGAMGRLWELHGKAQRFRDIDHSHATHAQVVYNRVVSFAHQEQDAREELADWTQDFIIGAWDGAVGLVSGTASLVSGSAVFLGEAVLFAFTEPFGLTPDWLKRDLGARTEAAADFLLHPFDALERGVSDFYDDFDRSPAYAIGKVVVEAAASALAAKAAGKVGEALRTRGAGGAAGLADDAAEAAGVGRMGSVDDIVDGAGMPGLGAVDGLRPQELMDELAASGVKYSPERVVMVTHGPDDRLFWLETGNMESGLEHIIAGHADDFANIGISTDDIPNLLENVLANGINPEYGNTVAGPNVIHEYQGRSYLIAYGTNGYIVTFHPYSD
jgi:hypothetical protein